MPTKDNYVTVTALNRYLAYKFKYDQNLRNIFIKGEISNLKYHDRGYIFFTLKDEGSQIGAICYSNVVSSLKFKLENGMKVYLETELTVYEKGGNYRLNVKAIEVEGLGNLYLKFIQLRDELSKKGYFAYERKRPIPKFPKVIGVVTSPTGAVIRDIYVTLSRRYPLAKIILYPALVQGEAATSSIAKQIEKANSDSLADVLIVGRGGGSLEDLWAFNEIVVADAVFNSKIPVISAVGHENDYTICDFVADARAATPTAAAEIASPSKYELANYLNEINKRIKLLVEQNIISKRNSLEHSFRLLKANSPLTKLSNIKQSFFDLSKQLDSKIKVILDRKQLQFKLLDEKLKANSPLNILNKGYSVTLLDGKSITDINEIKINAEVETIIKNGSFKSIIKEVKKDGE